MSNIDKVSAALSEWLFNVAKSVLPKFSIPNESAIGKFMYGILGISPGSYNVWNELGFLAEPLIQTMVTPLLQSRLSGIPDEQVKEMALKFADAFIEQAKSKKHVNLFGIELGENAFKGLKDILTEKFEEE
jgi:hypothetical protein